MSFPVPSSRHPAAFAVFVALAILLPNGLRGDNTRPRPVRVVITQHEGVNVPDDSVTCAGTVYGYITFAAPLAGKHVLSSVWIRPNGDAQDNSDVTLDSPPPGRRTAEVWLRFNDRTDGALSPVSGDGDPTFNGDWRLSLHLDGRPIAEQGFRVKC